MPNLSTYRRALALPASRQTRLPRWVVPLVVLSVLALLLNAFGSSYLTTYRLRREAVRLDGEVQALRRDNAQLGEGSRRRAAGRRGGGVRAVPRATAHPGEGSRRLPRPVYIERLGRGAGGWGRPD